MTKVEVVGWGCHPDDTCWINGCTNRPSCLIAEKGYDVQPSCRDHVPSGIHDGIAEVLARVLRQKTPSG